MVSFNSGDLSDVRTYSGQRLEHLMKQRKPASVVTYCSGHVWQLEPVADHASFTVYGFQDSSVLPVVKTWIHC